MKVLVCLFAFFSATQVCAQTIKKKEHFFAKKLEVGGSFTYIWDSSDIPGAYRYNEFSGNLNAKVSLTKKLFLGVQLMPVTTKINDLGIVKRENYTFFGILTKYAAPLSKTMWFNLEVSLNRSNMLRTRFADPIKKEDLYYLGYGVDLEILLNRKRKKNLFFELGLFHYRLLNDIDDKINFVQYIIGLNYHFGKSRKV